MAIINITNIPWEFGKLKNFKGENFILKPCYYMIVGKDSDEIIVVCGVSFYIIWQCWILFKCTYGQAIKLPIVVLKFSIGT